MVTRSGSGRTCWTSKPAGRNGRRGSNSARNEGVTGSYRIWDPSPPQARPLHQTPRRAQVGRRSTAILLTLSGWTSSQIAEAFGVREDTVRFWRSAFTTGGIEALKTSVAPGPAPVKAERALAAAEEVLSGPARTAPTGRCRVSQTSLRSAQACASPAHLHRACPFPRSATEGRRIYEGYDVLRAACV